ncbi:unnamed protein product, partial [Closterium sp. NIES-54]
MSVSPLMLELSVLQSLWLLLLRWRTLGPAPLGVSQVDPPPLVEPQEISSNSSGPAEGGDPAADNTAATRPSSPPLQPVAVDTSAAGGGDTGSEGFGGAETGGEDFGGAGSGGADSGGADSEGGACPSGGEAVGSGVGQQQPPSRLEMPSPQQLREWFVRRGRSGAGAWSFLDAGVAGAGDTAGGAASARAAGARGAAGGARAAGAAGSGGTAGGAVGPRPLGPLATATATAATATAATAIATAATAAPACCATMASLRVLAFDHEGRPVQFDTWLDDLQLHLLSNSKDSVLLFDLASGAAPAPPATADSATCSHWLTRDAAARLAIRNHLSLAECAHFGQHRTAQALYAVVVARHSSPATAALGRLLLPYLFLELSPLATVEDLVSHLRTSDARYRATVPAEDHFLSHDPTSITVDLLEQHLLIAETSAVAVGAAHGTLRPPFFEGCSPSPLAPSYTSAAATYSLARLPGGAVSGSIPGVCTCRPLPLPVSLGGYGRTDPLLKQALLSQWSSGWDSDTKRRSSKGKGGRGGGGGSGGGGGGSGSGGGGSSGGSGGSGGGGGGGTGGGSGGFGGSGGGSGGSGGSGGGGSGGGRTRPRHGGPGGGQRQQQQRRSETPLPQQLREWLFKCGTSGGSDSCPIAIFDLDFDAILSAMYALSVSAEGDCYRCVPPDPGIAAAALGASESCTLPGTAPAQALHTFTLDSDASRCFFCDSTTLTPLPAPVPVRLADPSGGPVVAHSSTVLPCPADPMVTTTTPGGQRVLICTCTRTGPHLATFTRRPGSNMYTLATEPPQVAASAQQPSRPAAEPPEPPSSRAARAARAAELPELPSCPAIVPLLHLLSCPGPTYSDWADGISLFDLTSGASPTPPATADSTVRSQWATCDAAARLAVHRHLPTTERAHFSQYRSAQTLYDAVVARYSSPATAALSRLFLPYLFPDLAAFPTVADLITHLRTSHTRYRAALPTEFCAKNPPHIYLTLYYVVTRLPDSLRVVRDHFLSVCPTTLTVDLLEQRLLVAEQSIVA